MLWWDCETANIFHIKRWSLFLLPLTLGSAMRHTLANGTFALANMIQAKAWNVLVYQGLPIFAAPEGLWLNQSFG